MLQRIQPAAILVHILALALFLAFAFFLYYHGGKYIDVANGFIICRNDCSNFNRFSDYLAQSGQFYAADQNFHSTHFYRGYVLMVAAIKVLFGPSWQVAYYVVCLTTLFFLVVYAARVVTAEVSYWPKFAVGYLLVLGNLNLLTYSRTLLSDLPFAVGANFFFVTLVSGLERRSWPTLATALALAVTLCFVRTSGIFLVILAAAAVMPFAIGALRRRSLDKVAPAAAGLTVFVALAVISQALVTNWDRVHQLPGPVQGIANEILEVNYFGEDNMTPETRYGAIIVESKRWSLNDGTWLGIASAFLERIATIFEIRNDEFSARHNAYRYALYGVLYVGLLAFLAATLLQRKERLRYLALWTGYALIFVTVSHVPARYRLTFDLMWILATMSAAAWLWSEIQRRRSMPADHHFTIRASSKSQ